MNRRNAHWLFSELATACTAITLLFGVACAIRLAFGIDFGALGPVGLGFAVLAAVARMAARRYAPPRRRPIQNVTVQVDDTGAREQAEAIRASLADLEHRRAV